MTTSQRDGMALVIVLCLIVLITALVLAYFSRAGLDRQISDTDVSRARIDWLTKGSVNQFISDLQQEIAAGSDIKATNGITLFFPKASWSASPYRVGSTNSLPNLIKRSSFNQPFFDAALTQSGTAVYPLAGTYSPSKRASDVPTSNESNNGRLINAARWNKSLLLPKANPVTTDTTPISDFVVPDWIYVSRDGSNPTAFDASLLAPGSNTLIGRYAYAAYDEGGLLDANVAGYSATASPVLTKEDIARKGSLGLADLTKTGLTSDEVDKLVQWRNAATLLQSDTAPYNQRYLSYLFTNTTGFLSIPSNNSPGTENDKIFSGRQSLMKFLFDQFGQNTPAEIARLQNVLQYLGTFSRDLDQPSWQPTADRPKIIGGSGRTSVLAGGNMAGGLDDKYNPSVLTVRVKDSFHRISDDTDAAAGEPLVKYRFPLSRLAWLTCDGPAGELPSGDSRYVKDATTENVEKQFGLRWESNEWVYIHGNATVIRSLGDVAAQNREPDFFELLQAAISVGSLGKGFVPKSGDLSNGPPRTDERSFLNGDNGLITVNPSYQVLEIGANIIDQADADSYPTVIRFESETNDLYTRYGDERLPRLSRFGVQYSKRVPAASAERGAYGAFLLCEVWDPHESTQNPPNTPVPVPTQFRLKSEIAGATQEYKVSLNGSGIPNDAESVATVNFVASDNETIEFSGSPGDFSAPLLEPGNNALIYNTSLPSGRNFPRLAGLKLHIFDFDDPADLDAQSFITTPTPNPPRAIKSSDILKCQVAANVTIALQFLDSGGIWRTYSRWRQAIVRDFSTATGTYGTWLNPNGASSYAGPQPPPAPFDNHMQADPRSDRFPQMRQAIGADYTNARPAGDWGQTAQPQYNLGGYRSHEYIDVTSSQTARTPVGWFGDLAASTVNFRLGLLARNLPDSIGGAFCYYNDPDGIRRGGDEQFAPVSGPGLMLPVAGTSASRPIVLNRPFRNVGELGYAFRGAPFKSLDFASSNSGDAALLDFFCVSEPAKDSAGIRAGAVNPNTRQPAVIQALLSAGSTGTILDESPAASASFLTDSQINTIATKWLAATLQEPVANQGDMVARAASGEAYPPDTDSYYKRRREAVVRVLSAGTTSRIWNIMLDVIVQVGKLPPQAKTLGQFTVEGEKRLWVHLAIDRVTGKVVDSLTEEVVE